MAVFRVTGIERIEPKEKRSILNAVKLYEVAFEMTVYYSPFYAAQEILLKHFLCFLGVAYVAYVLLVHGVEVAAFYPASGEIAFFQCGGHPLVRIHDKAFRIRYARAYKNTGHALAGAVLYAVARVYDKRTLVLAFLQQVYGFHFAAHVDYDILFDLACYELLLAVDAYYAPALAQLVGGGVEYGRVVSYMIGRVCSGSHDAGDFYICHDWL